MTESNDQAIACGKSDTATTLTDLFIMLALERYRGTAKAGQISELLAHFGIVISTDTIKTTAGRRGRPYEKNEKGTISFVESGGAVQSMFLARAITAINARNSMMIPRRAFQFGASGYVRGTWTPSGFTAHWLDEQETIEEKAARAKPMDVDRANWRIPPDPNPRQDGGA